MPQLIPGYIPSKMPNCPDYLSAPTPSVRKSREIKLQDREQNEFASAIRISAEEYKKKQQQYYCKNLQQIKEKFTVKAPWKVGNFWKMNMVYKFVQ